MKTTVNYSFTGPAGNFPGIPVGKDLGTRSYESAPFVPAVGAQVTLSYGTDLAQSAIFTVEKVLPSLTKTDVDVFDVFVSLK